MNLAEIRDFFIIQPERCRCGQKAVTKKSGDPIMYEIVAPSFQKIICVAGEDYRNEDEAFLCEDCNRSLRARGWAPLRKTWI